ncbi:MAG TPA: MBOAT family O-acyltransferase [Polyangiaceae bacterium]|nr:MBOAT family O-acyltransferase [Polyangiaceae bacterium]
MLLVALAAYVVVGHIALRVPGIWRMRTFAVVNVLFVFVIFYRFSTYAAVLGIYAAIVVLQWLISSRTARGGTPWLAMTFPLLVLAWIKYLPGVWAPAWSRLPLNLDLKTASLLFVGLSYMAFRLTYLVTEVRNGIVPHPDLGEYLSFAFFVPTMAVGPISRYSTYAKSLASDERPSARLAAMRIVVGIAKYLFIANLMNQLTYAGLLTDGRVHPHVDWLVAMAAYYVYLYCNFSGFCDIGIGIAGLLGVRVDENFDRPFLARNVKDFWNRWHITLSIYMRDMVFTPLSKMLVKKMGPRRRDHALAIGTFVVFVLVGIWHGAGINFVLFGVLHAVAVVANHYYGIALRKRLGADGMKAYLNHRGIQAAAVVCTFLYVSASLAVFANTRGIDRTLQFLRGMG